jgi:peptidoglycan/LPS O-acetylase OafA/YrhL
MLIEPTAPHSDAAVLSESKPKESLRFNPGGSRNLDILRMIAVLLVVQDHLFTFWGYPEYLGRNIVPPRLGRFGVVLFFVHTALVLMASMERQWKKTGSHRFVPIFLVRRGFRIYPLAVAALLITVAFNIPGQITINKLTHVTYGKKIFLANLLLIQNFAGGEATSILSPMWSLAFEWQMYLVLPIFYFICRRISNLIPLLIIWCIPILLYLSYSSRISAFNKHHDFWQIPNWGIYAPCFIAGIIAFFIAYKQPPEPILPWFALPLAIFALFLPVMATSSFTKFVPAALIIALVIPLCREIKHGWFSEMARIIVRYSYGIYLFHMLGIWLGFVRFKHETHAVQWLIFAAVTALLPIALYQLLEHPAIVLGNRIAKRLEPRAAMARPSEVW